jgi:SNF2 family DNA or RNA helicase
MIVIHLSVLDGRCLLWGESPALPEFQKRRGRPPKKPRVVASPFNAVKDELVAAMEAAGIARTPNVETHQELLAWLPTVSNRPVASSLLVADPPPAAQAAELRPWQVGALPLNGWQVRQLLQTFRGRPSLAGGLVAGSDFSFWEQALRLAGSLARRGRFLPGLRVAGADYYACWEPVYMGEDTRYLTALAASIPAPCRCLTADTAPPSDTPVDILTDFIGCVVDAFVRSEAAATLDRLKTVANHPRQIAKNTSAHQRWLVALTSPTGLMLVPDSDSPRGKPLRSSPTKSRTIQKQDSSSSLAMLAAQVEEWRHRINVMAAAPFRFCLRMEEPTVDISDITPGKNSHLPGSEQDHGREQNQGQGETLPKKRGRKPCSTIIASAAATAAQQLQPDEFGKNRLQTSHPETSAAQQHGGQWNVRYLIQAADDPSLLVELGEAWSGRKRQVQPLLQHCGASIKEFALIALGQAACLYPEIEQSLRSGVPTGFTLDSQGAYQFLTNAAPLLKQAGFVVLLPSWWSSKGTGARLALRGRASGSGVAFSSGGGVNLDQVLNLDWEVALGGNTLTKTELEGLARLKAPLVRLRGQWVEVNAEEIRATISYWNRQQDQPVTGRQAIRLALGIDRNQPGLTMEQVVVDGPLAGILKQLEQKEQCPQVPPPAGLHATLRPYQLRGLDWLDFMTGLGFGTCLADDMGLGKTIQTLSLLLRRQEQGEKLPYLLVCPTSVIANWEKETKHFTPDLSLLVHHGVKRSSGRSFKKAANDHALVVTSYSLLARDQEVFKQVKWAGIILDEAQNIKNPSTRQAQAARSLAAGMRIALTGTPVENNVGDLWSIMEFLNPRFLGSQTEFKQQFLAPIQAYRDEEATTRLKQLTGPFILRRLKTDRTIITDLPDKIETKTYCHLTQEQASLYTAIVQEVDNSLEQAAGIERKGLILATLSKLKQVCNHPAQLLKDHSSLPGRSGKLNRLTELFEEILASGERTLIFTQFAEMGELLRRYLMGSFGREVLFLHGSVPKQERDRMVELFQKAEGPPVFILSLKAGGTGLNLTAASHVIHFDRWWNPAVENQATDRAFRIGQLNNVQVHKFICQGTIEERIDEMIERKQQLAEQVVGTGEGWLTELSTGELHDLMQLRQEALGDW